MKGLKLECEMRQLVKHNKEQCTMKNSVQHIKQDKSIKLLNINVLLLVKLLSSSSSFICSKQDSIWLSIRPVHLRICKGPTRVIDKQKVRKYQRENNL